MSSKLISFKHHVVCLLLALVMVLGTAVLALPAKAAPAPMEDYLIEQIDLMGQSEVDFIDCSAYLADYNGNIRAFSVAISNTVKKIFNDHPEFFFCKLAKLESDGKVYFNYINYSGTDQLFADYATVKTSASSIISAMDASYNDYTKALYLHDALIEQTSTVTTGELNKYIAAVLVNGQGTSEAYAKAYDYLLKLCNIESSVIRDTATNHYWNALKLNDYWYYVDVYNDDSNEEGRMKHASFLMNNSQISSVYSRWTFANSTLADDTTYLSDPVKNALTKVYIEDSDFIYIDQAGKLVAYNTETSASTTLYTVTDRWESFAGGGYYASNYSALAKVEDYYLISTPTKVLAYKDNTAKVLYTTSKTDKNIYGLNFTNDTIDVVLRESSGSANAIVENITAKLNVRVADKYVEVGADLTDDNIQVNISYLGEEINIHTSHSISLESCTVDASTSNVGSFEGEVAYAGNTASFHYTTYILGDLSRDGKILSDDVLLMKLALVEAVSLSEDQLKSAKFNGDSLVSNDLVSLKQLILGIN